MNMVSVVVATYRREESLKKALESLANQTYKNLEIVIVDDNGNDEWNKKIASMVHDFRSAHSEIKMQFIVNRPNHGSAKTRNIGIEASKGEYITFLDDDDLYLPNKVQRQVEFMESDGCDYSVTDLYLFNENDKLIDKRIRSDIKDTTPEGLLVYHLKHHITGTDTMMFRKEYLIKIGGFAPIDVGDEFYLMQRAIEGGGKFGYLPGSDIKAYIHTGETGLSSGVSKINGENALYDYKKQFFCKMDEKTKRYIKMRHYAVLAFAGMRVKKYVYAFVQVIKSFFAAPFQFMGLIVSR